MEDYEERFKKLILREVANFEFYNDMHIEKLKRKSRRFIKRIPSLITKASMRGEREVHILGFDQCDFEAYRYRCYKNTVANYVKEYLESLDFRVEVQSYRTLMGGPTKWCLWFQF